MPCAPLRSGQIISTARAVFGDAISGFALKHTFTSQFTGGESLADLKPTIGRLNRTGTGAILDYAVEADVPASAKPPGDAPETPPDTGQGAAGSRYDVNTQMLDRREGALAKTFFSESDEECAANVAVFKTCIEEASTQPIQPFAAVKVTAMINPAAMLSVSKSITQAQALFRRLAAADELGLWEEPPNPTGDAAGDAAASLPAIAVADLERVMLAAYPALTPAGFAALAPALGSAGRVDYIDWLRVLDGHAADPEFYSMFGLDSPPGEDLEQLARCHASCASLADLASARGATLMFDAEQTYFQPTIDMIIRRLQRTHNTGRAVVYNTFQCYLKDSLTRAQLDMGAARRDGFFFGCKYVRGAYIIQERERAQQMGYEDPCWPTIEDTHATYDRCVEHTLGLVPQHASFMIASHNQASIERAVAMLRQPGNAHKKDGVFFAQLYGMADHLTSTLAAHEFTVYKYLPYGPLFDCVAYLVRRIEENSTMLGGEPIKQERGNLVQELFRRAGLGS